MEPIRSKEVKVLGRVVGLMRQRLSVARVRLGAGCRPRP